MSGFSKATHSDHLVRSEIWSTQLKDVLEAELMGTRWVRNIEQFTDGDLINIPSLGQMTAGDYDEGQPVNYQAFDTGNFEFTITEYVQSGTYIYNKFKQDSMYMSEVVASFVPKMSRAIMTRMEEDILAAGPAGQTSANSNTINGAKHRWIGSGTNEVISVLDFQKAAYAFQKANVPMKNLVAIVDPSCEFELGNQPNLVNFSNNPRWEGIVTTGLSSGMKFIRNIWGFDVYTSQYLKVNTTSEAIDGTTAAAGVNNLFFSASSDVLPLVMQVRQPPKVDSEYNKDYQRDEYVTTARWGVKLFRPENLVCVVTDTDQVYA
jgi:hypothetical protein